MQAADFKGLYAIIPTPARPGADRIDAKGTVALDETERLLGKLLRDGADGLIVLGTTGECATITQADYRAFVDCVCRVVDKRIPLFAGATAMGGHETHERMTFAQAQGADGALLGLPMWQPCTTDMAVKFYTDVAAAFPRFSVMVYANSRAFRYTFPSEFWAQISVEAPTVVAVKSSHVRDLSENLKATGGRIHFMPSDMVAAQFRAISPSTTTSCWATAAGMGPEPSKALIDAIAAGDEDRIQALAERIAWANAPLGPMLSNPEVFASYNIQAEKTRMNEAGYCDPGPTRPPYNVFPPAYADASREAGRRWRQLRADLSGILNAMEAV